MEITSLKWTCLAAPVQAEGELEDGKFFYFRARHSGWSFSVGDDHEDAVNDGNFSVSAVYGKPKGDEASWMTLEEATRFIKLSAGWYEKWLTMQK